MDIPQSDRRRSPRLPLKVDVTVQSGKEAPEVAGTTRDLSSNGVFLYADAAFEVGSQVEMVLILPPELAGGQRQWACCQASVVRVESAPGSKIGVAATIHEINLLPEIAG